MKRSLAIVAVLALVAPLSAHHAGGRGFSGYRGGYYGGYGGYGSYNSAFLFVPPTVAYYPAPAQGYAYPPPATLGYAVAPLSYGYAAPQSYAAPLPSLTYTEGVGYDVYQARLNSYLGLYGAAFDGRIRQELRHHEQRRGAGTGTAPAKTGKAAPAQKRR